MEEGSAEVAGEFRASWRSAVGVVALLLAAVSIGLVIVAWRSSSFGWLLFALMWGLLALLLSRPLRARFPLLRVDAHGIGSHWLKGRTIAWAEVVDVYRECVQGHPYLVLQLGEHAPSLRHTARLLGSRKPIRRIPLGALRSRDEVKAVATVKRAFLAYGNAQPGAVLRPDEDPLIAQAQFAARLKTLTPLPWALYLIVGLNVAIWLANVATGMSPVSPQSSELFRWGANSAWAVTQEGQLWRLVTATFLHGGIQHLALNMFGLWSAGLVLNRLHGNLQFLIIYFVSAVVGSALGLHFSAQRSVSVGASGAVFGVLGGLLVALLRHRHHLPRETRKNLLISQAAFILMSLMQGLSRANIDNAAHIGGLMAGGACAWLLVERLDTGAAQARRRTRMLLTLVAGVAAVGLLVRSTGVPPINHTRSFQTQAGLQAGAHALQEAESALGRDSAANKSGQLSDADMLAAIHDRHLPAYRRARDALAALSLPASDPQSAVLTDFQELSALIVQVLELELRKTEAGADEARIDADIKARTQRLQSLGERLKSLAVRNKAR